MGIRLAYSANLTVSVKREYPRKYVNIRRAIPSKTDELQATTCYVTELEIEMEPTKHKKIHGHAEGAIAQKVIYAGFSTALLTGVSHEYRTL